MCSKPHQHECTEVCWREEEAENRMLRMLSSLLSLSFLSEFATYSVSVLNRTRDHRTLVRSWTAAAGFIFRVSKNLHTISLSNDESHGCGNCCDNSHLDCDQVRVDEENRCEAIGAWTWRWDPGTKIWWSVKWRRFFFYILQLFFESFVESKDRRFKCVK